MYHLTYSIPIGRNECRRSLLNMLAYSKVYEVTCFGGGGAVGVRCETTSGDLEPHSQHQEYEITKEEGRLREELGSIVCSIVCQTLIIQGRRARHVDPLRPLSTCTPPLVLLRKCTGSIMLFKLILVGKIPNPKTPSLANAGQNARDTSRGIKLQEPFIYVLP